jgi:putative mRNA 3-end processing factor
VIACDAPGAAELAFVSHAEALPVARGGAAHRGGRATRTQVLTTPETLTLMGPRGERLRARALSPGFGRPFTLGFLRLELIPAGHQLGAASLLCDTGSARVLYGGAVGAGAVPRDWARASEQPRARPFGPPGEVRGCDAVCVDAAFADPRFEFLPIEEAHTRVLEFCADARARGCAPVLWVHALGPAQDAARVLRADGWRVRADRAVVDATARYLACGLDVPSVARFSGKLSSNEVLLCAAPSAGGPAPRHGPFGARPIRLAWLSEWAGDSAARDRLRVDLGIPTSTRADLAGVVAYIVASGAREAALLRAPSDALGAELRRRKIETYPLGPPRQIGLFDGVA